jgi:magnesium transporter
MLREPRGCSTIRISACLANSDACAPRDSEESICDLAVVAAEQSSRQSLEVITFYIPGEPALELIDPAQCAEFTRRAVWIDMCEPTPEEEQALEAALGLDIPTREEMQAIELSSRLYKEDNVLYLTATVLVKAQIERPESAAVTFILTPEQLVTLRYETPKAFQAFRARREANLQSYLTSYDILAGLIDAIIERIADILEGVGAHLDQISLEVFNAHPTSATMTKSSVRVQARKIAQRDFVEVLRRIGLNSDLVSRARESLVSFTRLVAFFRETQKEIPAATEVLAHLKTVATDLNSLSDHATFLAGKVNFVLDATLGMINNEQNRIVKIVSIAAVVFLPPTLVASIYGMNFELMPELKWAAGYPFAIVLMVISAVLPYVWFKRKGWL